MANRNSNVVNNEATKVEEKATEAAVETKAAEPETKTETETKKKKFSFDWKKTLKTAGQVVTGVCAAIGAAGLASYGWDQLRHGSRRSSGGGNPVPPTTPTNNDMLM